MSNQANFKDFGYESKNIIEKDFLDKSSELLYQVSEILNLNSDAYVIKKCYAIKIRDIGKRCQKLSYKVLNNDNIFLTISFWLNKENGNITYDCELKDKSDFTLFKVIDSKTFENIYNFLIPYISEHVE